jgi:hypothetical protein
VTESVTGTFMRRCTTIAVSCGPSPALDAVLTLRIGEQRPVVVPIVIRTRLPISAIPADIVVLPTSKVGRQERQVRLVANDAAVLEDMRTCSVQASSGAVQILRCKETCDGAVVTLAITAPSTFSVDDDTDLVVTTRSGTTSVPVHLRVFGSDFMDALGISPMPGSKEVEK